MLGIILLILKIILWIILGILGLILLLLLMILFVPIRYSGMFSKCETIRAKGKISYLLNFIRVLIEFKDGQLKYKVKVLFFTVLKEGYEDATDTSDTSDTSEESIEIVDGNGQDETVVSLVKAEVKTAELARPSEASITIDDTKEIPVKVDTAKDRSVKDEEGNKDKPQKKKKVKKKSNKPKKASKKKSKKKDEDGAESSIDKVKRFYGFLKAAENRGIFKFVLRMVGKILKSILPRKIEGRLNFGTDDPATTGFVLAVVSSMYPIYQENFVITPDFEEPRIEGNVKGRGRIIIGVIVFYAVRIILDKRVRRLIKEVRK